MSEQQRADGEPLDRDESTASDAERELSAGRADAAAPGRMQRFRQHRGALRAAAAAVLIALGAASAFWWQARQPAEPAPANDSAIAAVTQALERLGVELERIDGQLRELTGSLDAERRAREALARTADALPTRLADIERAVRTLQGTPYDARGAWTRAAAEHSLTVASTELALGGRQQNALRALDVADGLLAALGDPTLAPVREALAAERLALVSVRMPDVEGIALTLAQLAERARDFALRAELPANYAVAPSAETDRESGVGRLFATVREALSGLVRVERRRAPLVPELTAAERLMARRQLELELTLARVAAVQGNEAVFATAVARAAELLQRDFDGGTADVESALARLAELRAIDIDPPLPVLGRALGLLRGSGVDAE